MRKFTLKGLILTVVFMLLGCLAIHAADDGLITKQITVKLDKAGTLPGKIGDVKKYKITNLKIVGEINGTDLCFIREMAGKDINGIGTAGKLAILDLSEAKIVEGGDCYYNYLYYHTSNDAIGDYAFEGCSGLTSVTIPSSVTSIGDYAFWGCCSLTSVTIPSSVTSIGDYAFWGCSSLTSLTIPSSVTSIGWYAFEGCSGLTSVTIPSSVTSIGSSAFSGCSGLTSLTIPSSVTSIGVSAFEGCSGLTSVTIPSSVTSIGNFAFSGCSGLTSVTITSGVTSIGKSAFKGCSGLTSVTIPSSVTSIGDNAFYGCDLKECNCILTTDMETYIGMDHRLWSNIPSDMKYFLNGQELTRLDIPTDVKKIGDYAFYRCSGLTSVTIPSSVTSMGESAFSGCSGLATVYVSWESPLSISTSIFTNVNTEKCILYVPKGTYDDYWVSNWGVFENIVEYDATGINQVTTSGDAKEISRYAVNGQRLDAPTKGLNIVKYSDGSVKKVVVQ